MRPIAVDLAGEDRDGSDVPERRASHQPRCAECPVLKFRFHPIADDLERFLDGARFARAIVIDEPVSRLLDDSDQVRTSSSSDTGLPAGIYSFEGMESTLLMQVGTGRTGASSELVLASLDDGTEHALIEALGWAEHLWSSGTPVPAPKFDVDDRAITVPGGEDVEVRVRTYDDGQWSYRVRGDSGVRAILESKLAPIEAADMPEDWVQGSIASVARFGATLTRTKLRGRFADTIYSFRATRTVFRPYQFKPVLKLLQTGQARILIADEVGLGKTIEAGLIWTELEARHDADRVLVVCPSGLVDKWRDEMAERFGFDLTLLDRDELKRLLEQHRDGRLPRRRAYVVSLETLRVWDALDELQENPPEFDLVIVDEAHAMRNSDTKSYQLGLHLSEWTIGSNMVFLTATPINLRETDLLHLLGLLEPADFDTLEDLEVRLQPNAVLNEVGRMLGSSEATGTSLTAGLDGLKGLVFERAITLRPEYKELRTTLARAPLAPKDIARARQLISELNALSTTVTRTRRAEVDEKKAVRDAEPGIRIQWKPAESEFYKEYLQWCERRAEVARTPMYFSMQMPIRLASTSIHLAARDVLKREAGDMLAGDSAADRPSAWVEPHPELVEAARRVLAVDDTKLESLGHVLAELKALERQALLFTWSKATLRYLEQHFSDEYRIAVLNGDVKRDKRRRIMKEFRAGAYDFVFANKVASEGLDFEFCSAVINYDLPWNPMEIEQRIGRIDRIGQESEKILIRNFYNDEAIDSRILYRVLQRIDIFKRSIGDLEPIIGEHMDLLRSAMDFRLSPAQQEEKATQFLTALEAQRAGLRDVVESSAGLIISNDVDVAGLEDELIATGRYLGQTELAHLVDDWAHTDGGEPVVMSDDGKTVEIRGNAAMATRLVDLAQRGRRTRGELGSLISSLQSHLPILLSLDQELSRTSEVELLSATHPLVMAAAEVPGHRHARFATVRIRATPDVAPGDYLVVLAHAEHASRGGDEVWGAAVDFEGRSIGEDPADAVMASLARGDLHEGKHFDSDPLHRLAVRARRELERRHRLVQEQRDLEEGALTEARRAVLAEQHSRRLRGIERRMQTMVERGRAGNVIRMVDGQRRRQEERYQRLLAELDARKPKAVTLSYLAVCTLEVTG